MNPYPYGPSSNQPMYPQPIPEAYPPQEGAYPQTLPMINLKIYILLKQELILQTLPMLNLQFHMLPKLSLQQYLEECNSYMYKTLCQN